MSAAVWAVLVAAGGASWLLTRFLRGYALERSLLDVPNHRSSHTVATPRGGGLAIAAASLGGIAALGALGVVPLPAVLALLGGGAMIAAIGWLDDRSHVAARWRFLVHLAAASWALYWAGGLPALSLGTWRVELGMAGPVLGALGIVWLTNLYNFMDGIDGIAAGQALVAGAAGATLLLVRDLPALAGLAAALAGAGAGFLVWNWAPARIFMGDVGSGYLGYMFGTLAVASENAAGPPVLAWAVLLGVFVVDATVTLVRRMLRGEPWYVAHRAHAYQRAVDQWRRHATVTAAALAVSALLAMLAWWGTTAPAALPGAVAAATALLAVIYWAVERRRPMSDGR